MRNKNKKLYSNTKQTKNKIKKCLFELLGQKELSKVSITELVQLSGIYRATFYIHYRSLNDVILDIEKDVHNKYSNIQNYMQNIDIYENLSELIDMVGEYINEDKEYLNIMIHTKCFNRVTLKLKDLLETVILENFAKYKHLKDSQSFRLRLSVVTGGIVFAYRDWINKAAPTLSKVNAFLLEFSKMLLY